MAWNPKHLRIKETPFLVSWDLKLKAYRHKDTNRYTNKSCQNKQPHVSAQRSKCFLPDFSKLSGGKRSLKSKWLISRQILQIKNVSNVISVNESREGGFFHFFE